MPCHGLPIRSKTAAVRYRKTYWTLTWKTASDEAVFLYLYNNIPFCIRGPASEPYPDMDSGGLERVLYLGRAF